MEDFVERTRAAVAAISGEGDLPRASNEAEVAVSADLDAIVKRLDEGIPQLNARLDALLERQRRRLTA